MRGESASPQSSPRRGTLGASLVEFALILPIFVILIFGMITGGIALSQQNSIENAVRESSRFAAVSPLGTPPDVEAYLDDVIEQVEAAATGDLADSVEGKEICVAFTDDGSDFTSRTKTGGATPNTDNAECFSDSLGTDARTQVYATRRTEISAIFFDVPITLESQSVSRYER